MTSSMDLALIQAAYIIAGLLFILSLAGLSKHETAKDGNVLGMIGMLLALVATLWLALRGADPLNWLSIATAMAIGAVIGIWKARRVEMTEMPELIAMLHSFVGAAAVLVGFNTFLASDEAHHIYGTALRVDGGALM